MSDRLWANLAIAGLADVGYQFYDDTETLIGSRVTAGVIESTLEPGTYGVLVPTTPITARGVKWNSSGTTAAYAFTNFGQLGNVATPAVGGYGGAGTGMTVHALVLRLLSRIGITSFDPADNLISDGKRGLAMSDILEALACVNGAIQDTFINGPSELSRQDVDGVLRAPETATITCTEDSRTISGFGEYQTYMKGCTIRISGDAADNTIVSATALRRPFNGTTASGIAATIFFDAIPCDSNIANIIGPVHLPRLAFEMTRTQTREEFESWGGQGGYRAYNYDFRRSGQPTAWLADTNYVGSDAFTPVFLRVYPMPEQKYAIQFRAKINPPTYALADLYSGTAYSTDPGTIIPFAWAETTLLPLALQRFTAHPSFSNAVAAGEIGRQAEQAKESFKGVRQPTKQSASPYRRAVPRGNGNGSYR